MCEFCNGWKEHDNLYSESVYCDLRIGNALNKPSIIVADIRKGCPKGADCSAKANAPKVAFQINYCPNCGEKL